MFYDEVPDNNDKICILDVSDGLEDNKTKRLNFMTNVHDRLLCNMCRYVRNILLKFIDESSCSHSLICKNFASHTFLWYRVDKLNIHNKYGKICLFNQKFIFE